MFAAGTFFQNHAVLTDFLNLYEINKLLRDILTNGKHLFIVI